MPHTVCYHSVTTLTTFAAGMGQIQVVRAARLVGIKMTWCGIAGGGGTFGGQASAMLNQNVSNETATSNPPRENFLGTIAVWAAVSGSFTAATNPYIPLNIELRPGDLLTINAGNAGAAAPAVSFLSCDFYVLET